MQKVTIDVNNFGEFVRTVYKYGFYSGYSSNIIGHERALEEALEKDMEELKANVEAQFRIKLQ